RHVRPYAVAQAVTVAARAPCAAVLKASTSPAFSAPARTSASIAQAMAVALPASQTAVADEDDTVSPPVRRYPASWILPLPTDSPPPSSPEYKNAASAPESQVIAIRHDTAVKNGIRAHQGRDDDEEPNSGLDLR